MRRHVWNVSRGRPAMAQFEELIQLAGLLNAIIGIFQNVLRLAEDAYEFYGIEAPQKGDAG